MDDTTFKPYEYDPFVFIDFDKAVTNLLSSYSLSGTDTTQLSSSEFVNYIKDKSGLNLYQQRIGVEKYIGNTLIYL